MKLINKNTILKCEDKTFQPVKVNEIIYWGTGEEPTFYDAHNYTKPCYYIFKGEIIKREYSHHVESNTIVAQSQNVLEGVPIINLDNYAKDRYKYLYGTDFDDMEISLLEWQAFKMGYNSNKGYYSKEDIEKAIDLYRELGLNVDKTLKANVDIFKKQVIQVLTLPKIEWEIIFDKQGKIKLI